MMNILRTNIFVVVKLSELIDLHISDKTFVTNSKWTPLI
jgi:hypothetical protein